MAFDITPTSGDGPYIFTASFLNKGAFDTDRYALTLRSSEEVGSCPILGESFTVSAGPASLLATGTFTSGSIVPAGSCRAYTLSIVDIEGAFFVERITVQVSNV